MRDVHYFYTYVRLRGWDHWTAVWLSLELHSEEAR